jgi:tetratricopeptide (TPR) repeat protein
LSRDNVTLERAGRALALCGASAEAARLAAELAERFPEATLTTMVARPTIEAAVALRDGDAERAMAILEPVRPYDELRGADFWPAYLRGRAALMLKNAKEAAAQFEKILSRRGSAPDSLLYPLAHLGRGRAAVLAGDTAKARASYTAFLTLWQGADPDARPLQEARREYAQLR